MNVCVERCPQLSAVQVNVNWRRGSVSVLTRQGAAGGEVPWKRSWAGKMRRMGAAIGWGGERTDKEKIGDDLETKGRRRRLSIL